MWKPFSVSGGKKHRIDNIHYVPTVVNTDEYSIKDHSETKPVIVGWIGSKSTLRYLVALEQLVSFMLPIRKK